MNRTAFQKRPAEEEVSPDARDAADVLLWTSPIPGAYAQDVPVELENPDVLSLAHACRILSDGREHGPELGRRAGDHAQDVTGRCQVAIAGLELLEQPHVLNR